MAKKSMIIKQQKRMMNMSLIPCTSKCVYQTDGICTLNSAAAAGVPSLGGACIHFIPQTAAQLGSPHRYCELQSAPIRTVPRVPGFFEQE